MKKISFVSNKDLSKKEEVRTFLVALLVSVGIFSGASAYTAYATNATLAVTVNSTFTFIVTTDGGGAGFTSTLTPGVPIFATTTLYTVTNSATGYKVTLVGDNRTSNALNSFKDAGSNYIPDATQWIPPISGTSTPGNAIALNGSQEYFAYRVKTATGTTWFTSTAFWGTSDLTYDAGQLWGGVGSTTDARDIGRTSAAATVGMGAAPYINTVQYYLNAPVTQSSGAYTAPLTYSATAL